MRRQIVAACLLQYIFVGEAGWEERRRSKRNHLSLHLRLSSLRSARTVLLGAFLLPAAYSRGLPVVQPRRRHYDSASTRTVDISIIFKCIKARDQSRSRMKKEGRKNERERENQRERKRTKKRKKKKKRVERVGSERTSG
ncbi:hypothetical protein PUN28_014811 [Cardiocondyla obscurior]|uniref:Secreted protein n=1 Tax=Cardiocondyla obscurior TaxID=286306 RepID=A0AAW2F0M8_9HYME